MSTASPLPKKLRLRLAELGLRLHRMQVVQGLCRLVMVVVLAAAAAVVLDVWFNLAGWARGLLFVGWLGLVFYEVRRFARGPLARKLDAQGLASAIEQEFPRLGERLTTAVELAGSNDPANGSPELIDLVVRDAETRTRKLDLNRAIPATATIGFAIAGAAAIIGVLIPLVSVPTAGAHARRFLAPWYAPKADSFTIKVTSGDPIIKRGETATLSALIEPDRASAPLPALVTAAVRSEKGTEMIPMTIDPDKSEVYLTLGPLETGFEYQIVSGEAESGWHRVTVVEPVRLESSRVTIIPPRYARIQGDEPAPIDGLGELSALQHSRISYQLRFNRLPSSAWLEWKPEGDDGGQAAPAVRINVPVSADATGTVAIPAVASGECRLIAEVDKVRTNFPVQRLNVLPDAPPRFDKQEGVVDRPLVVRPTGKLRIDCTVVDDVAVAKVEMEYRVGDGPVKVAALPLKGIGGKQASGRYVFELDGKVKEGELLQYRLVATDNRDLPEAKLTPQQTYYPESGKWAELRIQSSAAPLKEQEISAKRDEIDNRLRMIIEALKSDQRAAYRLRIDTAKQGSLREEQAEKLNDLQKDVRKTAEAIDELSRDIALTPDLAGLAQMVRAVGEHEVLDADTSLRLVQREANNQTVRAKELARADQLLTEAIRKLEALRLENDRLAQERLEKLKLDQLAQDQEELAKATPKTETEKLDEVQRRQKELEERLRKLLEESAPLKNALEKVQAQLLEQSAGQLQQLEQELRDLTGAMKNLEQRSRENRVAALRDKQEELANRANELAAKTAAAARAAALSPLKQQEIAKASQGLKNGELTDAVTQQEKAVLELDRLAKELENAVARSKDPREVARLLERLQEELRQSVADATKTVALAQLQQERRDSFTRQQEAIRNAAQKLSIPADAVDAEKIRSEAVAKTTEAAQALKNSEATKADQAMQKAREAFGKLVERMPNREKRLAQAKVEVGKLRAEQDAIARIAEQNAKFLDKHDPDAAGVQAELAKRSTELSKRQAQAADKLSKLDLPGFEERQDKIADAMRQAKSDLDVGRPHDIAASQQAARRELERLEQALNGLIPADERADRIAAKQRAIAAELEQNAAKPNPSELRELLRSQAKLTQELQQLQAPEAPATKEAALEASRKAESAQGPTEAAKQAEEAANAVQTLADQINGREPESARVERLAKRQQDAADEADRLAKKKETGADLRKKTQQMVDEAKGVRPGDAHKERQQAVDALNRAQQANDPEQLARAEKEAAEALKLLAEKLSRQPPAEKPTAKKDPMESLEGVPTQAQADEARKLADEQRRLRDELARVHEEMNKKSPPPDKNALEQLVKEQEKVAKESAELAKSVERGSESEAKQARQAADAAGQASRHLKNGLVDSAKEAGQQTAQKLQQLAQVDPASDRGKQAKDLATRQEEINKKLEELSSDSRSAQAQQAERQKEMQQRIEELTQQLQNFGQQGGANSAREAASMGRRASEAMKNAREQSGKGERGMARDSQDHAADALRQAGRGLLDAAKQMMTQAPGQNQLGNQAGQSLQQARDQMGQAQGQLGQGKSGEAGKAMQMAADALKRVGRQMGKPSPSAGAQGASGQPGSVGDEADGSGAKAVDLSRLGPLGEKFKGKSWGELPGEIKNQLISDMKARYGEDYARYIKLYFEQLAERK